MRLREAKRRVGQPVKDCVDCDRNVFHDIHRTRAEYQAGLAQFDEILAEVERQPKTPPAKSERQA